MSEIDYSEPDLTASLEPLWERIREAIAWCMAQMDVRDPCSSLRSAKNQPRILQASYFEATGWVAVARAREVHRLKLALPPLHSLEGGRLLVYFPDQDLFDGAAEAASRGYFDVDNAPPWDTWLAMVKDRDAGRRGPYLLSWVPPAFLNAVASGIEVNPEQCILWLESADVVLSRCATGAAPA